MKCWDYKEIVFMEIKVNREIRQYTESLFLGLSLRQLIFSTLAIIVAVVVYFLLGGCFCIISTGKKIGDKRA